MTSPELLEGTGSTSEKVIAKPIYSLPRPLPLDSRLTKITEAIKILYGPDTRMHQVGDRFVVYTDGEICGCHSCDTFLRRVADLDYIHHPSFMIVCSVCGNKRCPHAEDHDNECTGSNAPGQPGSGYSPWAERVAGRTGEQS